MNSNVTLRTAGKANKWRAFALAGLLSALVTPPGNAASTSSTAGFEQDSCLASALCAPPSHLRKKPEESKNEDTPTPVDKTDSVVSDSDDNIKVDKDGALVVSGKTSKPYHINKNSPENAAIRLPKDQGVDISDDVSTLQYIDRKGGSTLLVKTVGSKKQLQVVSGDVEIRSTASGNVIPLLTSASKALGQIFTQTAKDAVRVDRTTSQVKFHVDEGKVKYQSTAQAAGVTLYRGENVRVDATAAIEKVTLGSADGLQNAPGDPLPRSPGMAPGTVIPYLDGKLARFADKLSPLDILRGALEEFTGSSSGQLSYDQQSGVVTYTMGRRALRLLPLGEVEVLRNQLAAASASATASGAFALASQGIQITLAGTVGYFKDLQLAVQNVDSSGTVTLRANGVLELRINGARYSALPSVEASLPEQPIPVPGFEADASGLAAFRDHLGMRQTLNPAFADTDQLTTTISQAIPGASFSAAGNGTYSLYAAGRNYTLMPEYALRQPPDSHAGERWWMEGGMVFLRNSDNSMQGLKIR